MSRKRSSKRTRRNPKAVLRLPDLDQAKSTVLNSLTSADAKPGYRLAAGIRRVKGVKKIGVRLGNWLTAELSQRLGRFRAASA